MRNTHCAVIVLEGDRSASLIECGHRCFLEINIIDAIRFVVVGRQYR